MGYTSMAQPCPADGTSGEFHNFPANSAGGYTIDIALRDAAGMILSEFASPTLEPFCDGFWTPTVILPVNR
jgi:hypothetical protein